MGFGNDRTKPPAAKMTAHLWNETERTRTITAFGDFYERVVARRGQHARRRFIIKISRALIAKRNHRQPPRVRLWIANAEDVVDLARANEGIDFRHFCFQLIAITLNQTAGDN